ncbi:hypothetical protein N8580_00320 [Akkermansiaceae bacterium]|nr:hypothetical protein [Akkermansiaceae bacterium]
MDQKKEIKQVIEQILGSSITMRTDSSNDEDKLKEEFIRVMTIFEEVWKRQNEIDYKYGADFSTYDDKFFRVIEGFIHFCFDGVAAEAIIFYIYARVDEEGNINPFTDPNGKDYIFNDLNDLWEFLMFWAEEMMKL